MLDVSFASQLPAFDGPNRTLNERDADQIRSRMAQSFGMTWVGADCAAEPYASYAVEGTQIALDAEIVRQTSVAAPEIENLLLLLEDMVPSDQSADLVRTIFSTLGLQATDRDVLAAIARVGRRRAARPAPIAVSVAAASAAPAPSRPVTTEVAPAVRALPSAATTSHPNESISSLVFKLIGTVARRTAQV